MKDIRGNRVPLSKKADAIAEYLFEKQWGPMPNPPPLDHQRNIIINAELPFNIDPFSLEEIQNTISSLKTNKAAGPDGSINELFKWLKETNLASLVRCLNCLWLEQKVEKWKTIAQRHLFAAYTKKALMTIRKTIVLSLFLILVTKYSHALFRSDSPLC